MGQRIATTCRQTTELLEQFCREQDKELTQLATCLSALFAEGGHLLIAGNGVLQPMAQQLASQFTFQLNFERPGLPAICLGSDPLLSSRMMVAGQLEHHLVKHYRAINSQSHLLLILNDGSDTAALKNLRDEVIENGQTIALISPAGAKDLLASEGVDHCLSLTTKTATHQLELTQFIGHLLCQLVEAELFGR